MRWARLIYGTDTAQTATEIAHTPTHRHPHVRVWVRLRTSSYSGIGRFEEFCSSVDKPEEKESGKKVLLQEYPTRPRAQIDKRQREREKGAGLCLCVLGLGLGLWVFLQQCEC